MNGDFLEADVERELKWKEYILHIEHYKYYLTIALQTNAFFYVTTGAVLGLYLNNLQNATYPLEYLLLLPILLGVTLGGIFVYGANLWERAYNSIENIAGDLIRSGFNIQRPPDVHLLRVFLQISGNIFFGVGVLLTLIPIIVKYPSFPSRLYGFVLIAIVFLVGGRLVPQIASRIDKNLKERRLRYQRQGVDSCIKDILSKKYDISSFEDHEYYNSLRPYLSKQTMTGINEGTLKQDCLLSDLRTLQKKWASHKIS